MDQEFIRAIIGRIKQNSINDEEIKRAFESYTMLMLDVALKDDPLSISLNNGSANQFQSSLNNSIINRNEELTHENEKL